MAARKRGFAFVAIAAAMAAACQIIAGVEDKEGATREPDASPAVDSSVPVDPCVPKRPPGPPQVADDGTKGLYGVFAVRNFFIQGAGIAGYDLDGRCTGLDGSANAGPACVAKDPNVDPSNGVDNAVDRAIDNAGFAISPRDAGEGGTNDPFSRLVSENIGRGSVTNLIGLFDYSGEPNDSTVSVGIVLSTGLEATGCVMDAGTLGGPKWDSCDTWSSAPGYIAQAGNTKVWSVSPGYVVNDQLVVIADKPVRTGLLFTGLNINGSVITGRLVRENGRVVGLADGVIAGRASATEIIGAVQFVEYQVGKQICGEPALLALLAGNICGVRDLPLLTDDDDKGKPCDALSFGFGFLAQEAKLGMERPFAVDAGCTNAIPACP
jgi:hypothetical protein